MKAKEDLPGKIPEEKARHLEASQYGRGQSRKTSRLSVSDLSERIREKKNSIINYDNNIE